MSLKYTQARAAERLQVPGGAARPPGGRGVRKRNPKGAGVSEGPGAGARGEGGGYPRGADPRPGGNGGAGRRAWGPAALLLRAPRRPGRAGGPAGGYRPHSVQCGPAGSVCVVTRTIYTKIVLHNVRCNKTKQTNMSRRQLWCVVHFMLTPKTPKLPGIRCPKQKTPPPKKKNS